MWIIKKKDGYINDTICPIYAKVEHLLYIVMCSVARICLFFHCTAEPLKSNVEHSLWCVYLQGVKKFAFVQCRLHLKLGKPTNLVWRKASSPFICFCRNHILKCLLFLKYLHNQFFILKHNKENKKKQYWLSDNFHLQSGPFGLSLLLCSLCTAGKKIIYCIFSLCIKTPVTKNTIFIAFTAQEELSFIEDIEFTLRCTILKEFV